MPARLRRETAWAFGWAPLLVAAGALLAGGCATAGNTTVVAQGGDEVTVEHGHFRGRWWQHYQRGRAFIGHELWQRAEEDMRVALAHRSQDQHWARTYGLHFIGQYFPNRELGVVLYRQDRLDEAAERLEKSLEQQHSARAAYFLGLVRRQRIKDAGGDAEPPRFDLAAGPGHSVSGGAQAQLHGLARDNTYVAAIRIEGQPYPIDVSAPEVEVRHPVRTHPGDNAFTVEVEDLLGNVTQQKVVLRADADGPVVSFDDIPALPGVLTGVAYDASGVERMRVAGLEAALTPLPNGRARFSVELTGTAPGRLTYLCEDGLGNRTAGAVRLPGKIAGLEGPPVRLAYAGGALPALLAPQAVQEITAKPVARILEPVGGRIFYQDRPPSSDTGAAEREIAVEIEVEPGASPLEAVQLNGYAVPFIPGRSQRQTLVRRLIIEGAGEHEIILEAVDSGGGLDEARISVNLEESVLQQASALRAAMLGFTHIETYGGEASGVITPRQLDSIVMGEFGNYEARFDFTERDPETLAAILSEQTISAELSRKEDALRLHQIRPAEAFIVGSATYYKDSLGLRLEAMSTEITGDGEVLPLVTVDVHGPTPETSDDIQNMVHLLVLRWLQSLPRAQGKVAYIEDGQLVTTLGEPAGVRRHQKAIVYKKGAPIPNPDDPDEVIGEGPPRVLAEARLTAVRGGTSDASLLEAEEPPGIEVGHFFVTK